MKPMVRMSVAGAGAVAVLWAAACNESSGNNLLGSDGGSGADGGVTAACIPADAGVPQLTDAQILQVLMTANQGEIDQAQAAQGQASNADVKSFAEQMLSEHTTANQKLMTLGQEQGLTAQASPTSQQLDAEAKQGLAFVRATSGSMLDLSYMDLQVKMHSGLLLLGDAVLMNQAQNAALKSALAELRATTQAHLHDAAALQQTLAPAP